MEDKKPSPFADLISGSVWLALAIAIMIGSWTMDRLVHLKVPVYTAPGVVPGFLGLALAIMGALLIVRAVRAGALTHSAIPTFRTREHWRLLTALLLCFAYPLCLLGSGLPFWLATAIFVAAFVFVFQFEDRKATGTLLRGAAFAALFGLICGSTVHYIFQELFLVRLP